MKDTLLERFSPLESNTRSWLMSGVIMVLALLLQLRLQGAVVGHWKFDDSEGITARDSKGDHDGKLTAAGAKFVPGGVAGGAVQLDRSKDGWIQIPRLPGLVTNDFSVAIWAKVPTGDTTPNTFLWAMHEAWYYNGCFVGLNQLWSLGAPSVATFMVNDGNHLGRSTSFVNDGDWHQLVFTYRLAGETKLYVDGAPREAAITSIPVVERSVPLLIGGWLGQDSTGVIKGAYTGWTDDLQVYDQALSDTEVDLLYQNPGLSLDELLAPLIATPRGGDFYGSVEMRFSSTVPGTAVRYTLDGSDPIATSPQYLTPLVLRETTLVKARLFLSEFPVSDVVLASFTRVPSLSFEPPGGYFTNAVNVSMINHLPAGVVRYTLDGSEPELNSLPYPPPLTLTTAATVTARVYLNGFPASETLSTTYKRVYAVNDGIPTDWREHYFGEGYLTDPRVAAEADPDGDGWSNRTEFEGGTDPTDKNSSPKVLAAIRAIPKVSWNSIPGLTYRVLRKSGVESPEWEVILPAYVAAGTNTVHIDVDAPPTAIYQIVLLP